MKQVEKIKEIGLVGESGMRRLGELKIDEKLVGMFAEEGRELSYVQILRNIACD